MAQEIVGQLAEQHGTDRVRDAIREAVIYEKRSLAYVRRVLEAWRRNGRSTEKENVTSPSDKVVCEFPGSDEMMGAELVCS